ncbi:MAG: Gfo/Idh/MocA family protein [Phycisphaerae bacterium]
MRIAIVGSYGHVGTMLNSLAARRQDSLVGVAPWGEDDPLSYLGSHPAAPEGTPRYESAEQLLAEVDADVVGVFTPLYRLCETSRMAIDAGAHVISEKPLAIELEDLHRLQSTAEEAGRRVTALFTMRAEPAFLAARSAVEEGLIGRPILAMGQKSYPFNQRDEYYKKRQTYGGSMLWQAIHALDFVRWCSGREYVRAAAMNANVAHPTHPGMEDSGGVLLEFDGGGHAVIGFDYLRPWPGGEDEDRPWGDDRLRLVGDAGAVEVNGGFRPPVLMTPQVVGELPLPEHRDPVGATLDSIEAGEADGGLVTMADSFRVTEVALRARDAADRGEVVDL